MPSNITETHGKHGLYKIKITRNSEMNKIRHNNYDPKNQEYTILKSVIGRD